MAIFHSGDVAIHYDVTGDGPPVLLMHGFPQTRAMWGLVVEALKYDFTIVTPDLRGYGASSKPDATPDLSNYAFRAMAEDQRLLMASLGFDRFHLVGHDRGGRVAHRMALDHPEAATSLTVMDIVPTLHLLENWSADASTAYFHWSYLAQPAPFPETMIEADPDHFYEACLLGWGGASLSDFKGLEAYRKAWRDPATIAGMTNDYRAAVAIDLAHDRVDRDKTVDCPALVLFGADGVMAKLYDVPGIWGARLSDMRAEAMPGGHFFVDQHPGRVAEVLGGFLRG